MAQTRDMTAVRQKFKELIDLIPFGDDIKKNLTDFFITKNDAELYLMIQMFLAKFNWVKWYWRLKRPRQ